MEALISNFRIGRKTKYDNQMVLYISGVKSRQEALKLVKKEVVWKTPSGKEIKGSISNAHGNKGAVRAKFETGMPGQSVGTKVEIR